MKLNIYIFILVNIISFQSCCTTNNLINKNGNTITDYYIKKNDTVIIYSFQHISQAKPPILIMSVKNKVWRITKYQSLKSKLLGDSIISYYCPNCEEIFKKTMNIGLLELNNENELSYPCKSIIDSTFNKKRISIINDLQAHSDVNLYKIEYKIGRKHKILSYRDPYLALKICPDSKERKKFLQIIELMKGL